MALTPERKVKAKVTNILREYGAYYFYPLTGGFGKSGVPDIVACYKGRFIGIECKAGTNRTTNLQEKNLEDIKQNGGIALVINEENVEEIVAALDTIARKPL